MSPWAELARKEEESRLVQYKKGDRFKIVKEIVRLNDQLGISSSLGSPLRCLTFKFLARPNGSGGERHTSPRLWSSVPAKSFSMAPTRLPRQIQFPAPTFEQSLDEQLGRWLPKNLRCIDPCELQLMIEMNCSQIVLVQHLPPRH